MMKYYKDYNLEDFLQDEDFRLWATRQDDSTADLWEEIVQLYPDKKVIMRQAEDLIVTWTEHAGGVTEAELEEQVQRILETTSHRQIRINNIRTRQIWISVAAVVLLTLGFAWYSLSKRGQLQMAPPYRQYVSQRNAPAKEIINSGKKARHVRLPDGTSISLNPGSRISYSEQFVQDKKREVFLSGDAFFNVVKDAQHPFFVYANGLATRVLGTSFRVRATAANVEVLVRSGRVSVLPIRSLDHPDERNTELLLTPNQQAIFSVKDHVISKSISNMPLELIRPESDNQFVFDNEPVSSVFEKLEKVYGIPIVYDAGIMANCSLRVELGQEPYFTKLDIITKTLGATYRVSDGQVVVTSEGCL